MQDRKSVAIGFAWRAANIGGVRRHLECIEQFSRYAVALYPSAYANDVLSTGVERNAYHERLGADLIDRHALFHSHVDPRFIGLAQEAQRRGKPWVHTYHALYFAEDWGGGLSAWQEEINRYLLKTAKYADRCLVVNSWLCNWLEETHGISTAIMPNAVDVGVADMALSARFEKKYGRDQFILFVGAVACVKNPMAFIDVAARSPRTNFVMIGTGLTPSEIYESLGVTIPQNLKALGTLPHNQTLDAIAACSVFVMTSHREGLPTVLLEAMAMQKPCVVPDAPWFADAIPSDEYGLRYEPGNLDDLADKIERALRAGPQPLARARVEEHFSWPVVTRKLDRIYDSLLC
jgi:glycosyltransferase involved in cell wall biosynthesis